MYIRGFTTIPILSFLIALLILMEKARYSFLGCDPFLIMKAKGRKIEVIQGGERDAFIGNPFKTLNALLKRYNRPKSESLHLPLQGGAVGYLGYDLKDFIEKLPANATDDLKLPDLVWGFYDVILIV